MQSCQSKLTWKFLKQKTKQLFNKAQMLPLLVPPISIIFPFFNYNNSSLFKTMFKIGILYYFVLCQEIAKSCTDLDNFWTFISYLLVRMKNKEKRTSIHLLWHKQKKEMKSYLTIFFIISIFLIMLLKKWKHSWMMKQLNFLSSYIDKHFLFPPTKCGSGAGTRLHTPTPPHQDQNTIGNYSMCCSPGQGL
jgi:hypothetical protein